MRVVFSFLPPVMMSGRRRLRRYPRRTIIWTEAASLYVRLRDCADRQQEAAGHDRNDQFHVRIPFYPSLFMCSREAGRSAVKSEAVFRSAKVECNLPRLLFFA